jgi:hypothetical protein
MDIIHRMVPGTPHWPSQPSSPTGMMPTDTWSFHPLHDVSFGVWATNRFLDWTMVSQFRDAHFHAIVHKSTCIHMAKFIVRFTVHQHTRNAQVATASHTTRITAYDSSPV